MWLGLHESDAGAQAVQRNPNPKTEVRLSWSVSVETNAETEWIWALGRLFLVGAGSVGGFFYLRDNPAFGMLLILMGTVLVYDGIIIALLLSGRTRWGLFTGLILDNAVLPLAWWVKTRGQADIGQTDDFYIAFFLILAIGAARLGWLLGAVYVVAWLGWISWNYISYLGPGSYDVQQLPLRLAFLAANSVLTLYLVSRHRNARRRAEATNEELSSRNRELEQRTRELQALNRFMNEHMGEVPHASEMPPDESERSAWSGGDLGR